MSFFSRKCSLAIVLTVIVFATACTSNDFEKYEDNGLIPGKESTAADVAQKAKIAAKQRDEESVGEAFDEAAEFLITSSPIWLPIIVISMSFLN